MNIPRVVSQSEWQVSRERLLTKEKELLQSQDELAAERRRLPMVRIGKNYVFEGPDGKKRLPELFEGRRQLIVYHFMLQPGSDHRCEGCSMFVDNIGHLAHIHARDTSLVLVSPAAPSEITRYQERMGWTVPWFSSPGNAFNEDMGAGAGFGLSVFLRDGDDVFRTYYTTARGVDGLGSNWSFLDLTPFGRQETWEDSPEGWPQSSPYEWWRLHDEYDA